MISYFDILLRFGLAMLVGIVVGIEREHSHHPAGLRTHVLVALSACVVMVTGQLIMIHLRQYGGGFDPARMACQIIPGIGFLGAGSIIQTRGSTKGVTTAAGLWATACIGMCLGAGFYVPAILAAVILMLILTTINRFRTSPGGEPNNSSTAEFKIKINDPTTAASTIRNLAPKFYGEPLRISLRQDETRKQKGSSIMVAHIRFVGTERSQNMDAFSFALTSALHPSHLEITMSKK